MLCDTIIEIFIIINYFVFTFVIEVFVNDQNTVILIIKSNFKYSNTYI